MATRAELEDRLANCQNAAVSAAIRSRIAALGSSDAEPEPVVEEVPAPEEPKPDDGGQGAAPVDPQPPAADNPDAPPAADEGSEDAD